MDKAISYIVFTLLITFLLIIATDNRKRTEVKLTAALFYIIKCFRMEVKMCAFQEKCIQASVRVHFMFELASVHAITPLAPPRLNSKQQHLAREGLPALQSYNVNQQ